MCGVCLCLHLCVMCVCLYVCMWVFLCMCFPMFVYAAVDATSAAASASVSAATNTLDDYHNKEIITVELTK